MKKENTASVWLGEFESKSQFEEFMQIGYSEDGACINSKFQISYAINYYDIDSSEIDWILAKCNSVTELLEGFTNDYEIIPQVERVILQEHICRYNSIVILYNYEYAGEKHIVVDSVGNKMEFIGDFIYNE